MWPLKLCPTAHPKIIGRYEGEKHKEICHHMESPFKEEPQNLVAHAPLNVEAGGGGD